MNTANRTTIYFLGYSQLLYIPGAGACFQKPGKNSQKADNTQLALPTTKRPY
jgi:hypothetical protein